MHLLELGQDTVAFQHMPHIGRVEQTLQCSRLAGRRFRHANHGAQIPAGAGLLDRPGDEGGTLRCLQRCGAIVRDDLEVERVACVFMILGMRRYRIVLHGRGDARWLRQLERQRRVEREGAHMATLRA